MCIGTETCTPRKPLCLHCETEEPDKEKCILKPGYCKINDKCYKHGNTFRR
eukprot:m.348225 g.348225  ORF g.348225 m.348225 type:complete len:51 (+) comp36027_c0_seq1:124-276(+)